MAIARLGQAVADYPHARTYSAWPGPNSNAFVAHLGREIPELRLTLPSTAIGKDYLSTGQLLSGMPTYTMGNNMLFVLASQKQYLALYVADIALVETFGERLGATRIGRSRIRFKRLEQLSMPAVCELPGQAYRNALRRQAGRQG